MFGKCNDFCKPQYCVAHGPFKRFFSLQEQRLDSGWRIDWPECWLKKLVHHFVQAGWPIVRSLGFWHAHPFPTKLVCCVKKGPAWPPIQGPYTISKCWM